MVRQKKPRGETRKRKQTKNQVAYEKALKNLKSRVKSAEKRGYIFSKDVIPNKPKRITQKTIKQLEELRGTKLYKEGGAEWLNESTGELISYQIREEIVTKQKVAKSKLTKLSKHPVDLTINIETLAQTEPYIKQDYNEIPPKFSEVIIRNYLDMIEQFSSAPLHNRILSWFNRIRDKYTDDDTAKMLQDGAEAGNVLTWFVFYDEQECAKYITEMTSYMPEMTEQWVKNFMNDLEEFDGESYNI